MPSTASQTPDTPRTSRGRLLRAASLAVAIAGGALLVALRRFHLPAPTGASPVGTCTIYLTDNTRTDPYVGGGAHRSVAVQLWYPAAPSSAAPAPYAHWEETTAIRTYQALLRTVSGQDAPAAAGRAPLLLFGPMWHGSRVQDTALAEDLASHGYIVAAVDHPGNGRRVRLPDGRVVDGVVDLNGPEGEHASAAARIAFWNSELELWAADNRFVLDRLLAMEGDGACPPAGHIDASRIGAFGHSFGGSAALRLLGLDPRVRSAVNLDGWIFGGLATRTTQPMMILYEDAWNTSTRSEAELARAGNSGTVENQMDRIDNASVDENVRRGGGYRLWISGAQHADFTDAPLLPSPLDRRETGPIDPRRMQALLRALLLGFFDETLRGVQQPWLEDAQQRFPEAHRLP